MVTGQEMSQSQNSSKQAGCCSSSTTSSAVSAELKLYQAFIFSVPIFFAFILLFMFYLFYLRRRRADWSSLRMRTALDNNNDLYMAELGLKKEVREMLPIIIYKETFSIRDTQCSVCLGDYQAEDKLQQIPACGHTFHMDCIDHWLANHTTCPLCRLSVLASPKASDKLPVIQAENGQESSHPENSNGSSVQPMSQSCEETHDVQPSEPTVGDARILQHNSEEQDCVDQGREFRNTRNETREHEGSRGISAA
ncbi:PREDICTED: RING-H2 finger protein ATL7 isoform X1 [Theobroma cacao]|uniref:RING-type E3 ubiquitin transferase n=2 Tax=Theobroma cacao TaxID=3641 RepID=A0AB32WNG0_THECC|nr:PREDICTED: RING-H2 finger protein ATL7 isoform X1 [Theobroma cacao]